MRLSEALAVSDAPEKASNIQLFMARQELETFVKNHSAEEIFVSAVKRIKAEEKRRG